MQKKSSTNVIDPVGNSTRTRINLNESLALVQARGFQACPTEEERNGRRNVTFLPRKIRLIVMPDNLFPEFFFRFVLPERKN